MDDEDLVDEGSALYLHLKDTGFHDFEAKTTHKDVEHDHKKDSVSLSGCLVRNVNHWNQKLKSSRNQQRWKDAQRVVNLLLDSRVLLVADRELIREWVQPQEDRLMIPGLLALSLTAGVLLLPLRSLVPLKNAALFQVTLLSIIKGWEIRKSQQLTAAVTRYIETAEQLIRLLNKSIRLLQEKIVVARGFTFAVGGSWGKEEEENSSGWYYCSSLRDEVCAAERAVLELYRSALSSLLDSHPLSSHLDHSEQYITLHPQEEQPRNLSKLKQHVSVVAAAQSEVVRRLILCFVPDLSSCVPSVRFFGDFLGDLTCQLDSVIKQLNIVYRYSKAPSNTVNREEARRESPDHVLYLPIRSLSLHLEAALAKLHSLEDSIASAQINEETLEENLKRCKLELDACCVCYEDALKSLKLKSEEESPKKVVVPTQMPSAQSPKVIPFKPYVAQDEVLEATVGEERYKEEVTDMIYDVDIQQDREKRKMEKEYVKNVFGELKSVLVEKAAEWKKREEVAIARLKQERGEDVAAETLEGNRQMEKSEVEVTGDNDDHRERTRGNNGAGTILDVGEGSYNANKEDGALDIEQCRDNAVEDEVSCVDTSSVNLDNNICARVENDHIASEDAAGAEVNFGEHNSDRNVNLEPNVGPGNRSTLWENNLNKEPLVSNYTPLIIAETNTSSCGESDETGAIMSMMPAKTRRRRSLPRRTRPPQRKTLVNLTSSENSLISPQSETTPKDTSVTKPKPCLPFPNTQSFSSLLAAEAVAKSAMFKVRGEEESFGGDSDSD